MRRTAGLLIFLSLVAVSPLAAGTDKKEALADFAGAIQRVTKKEIVIQTDAGNEMIFIRTKRTRFTSAGRPLDGGGLPQGITVNVQAFERLNRDLEAVAVTVAFPDQSPNK